MVRLTKIAIILIALLVVAAVAIPKLLSTSYVKERIAGQLSEITGRPVSLNGGSSISLYPYLSVTYLKVSIGGGVDNNLPAIVEMDSLRAKLSIFSAIRGDARISEMELVRPRFNFTIGKNGGRNWLIEKGPLAERLSLNPGTEPSSLPMGTINIVDGIVRMNDERTRVTENITGLNGSITWADVVGSGQIKMSAIWNGEAVTTEALLSSPFELLRGGISNIEITFSTTPLQFSFTGQLDSHAGQGKGHLDVSSPSINRLSEWLGSPIPATKNMPTTSMSGKTHLTSSSIEFPESEIKIGNHTGNGRLQIAINKNNTPSISGTLAFNTLELQNFIQPLDASAKEDTELFPTLNGFNVDLRISANTAISPMINLSDFAATVIIRDETASFDIGLSETLGGTLTGSVVMKSGENENSISSNLTFTDVDLAQLSMLYGENLVTLKGVGSAEFQLKSTGTTRNNLMERMNGEGLIHGKNGTIEGIDLLGMLSSVKKNPQKVSRLLNGETPYNEIKLGFFIANGTAFFRGSKLLNDKIAVELKGRSDLAKRSLALRGRITSLSNEGKANHNNSLPFFVGGTTTSPLFVPLPGTANPTSSKAQNTEPLKQ